MTRWSLGTTRIPDRVSFRWGGSGGGLARANRSAGFAQEVAPGQKVGRLHEKSKRGILAASPCGSGAGGMVSYRKSQVTTIPTPVGCYALCDVDEVPIYVGQSTDGIRARVQRHLTSARSDVIANRQIDVWEIAYVWAWPIDLQHITALEAHLFHEFDAQSPLMNGAVPADPGPPPLRGSPEISDTGALGRGHRTTPEARSTAPSPSPALRAPR